MEAATPLRSHAKSSNATCPASPATFIHQNLPPPSPSLMARRIFVPDKDVKTQPVVAIPPLLSFSPLTKISKPNPANGSFTLSRDAESMKLSSKSDDSVPITTPMKTASVASNTPSKGQTPSLKYIPAANEKRKPNYPPLPFHGATHETDAKCGDEVSRTPLRPLTKRNLDSSSFSSSSTLEAPPQGHECSAPISSNILETPKTSRKSIAVPYASHPLETPKTSRRSMAIPFTTPIMETPKTSRKSIAVMSTEMTPMLSRKEDHVRSHVESMLKKVLSLPPESSNPARRVFVKEQPSAPCSSTPNVPKTPHRKSQIGTVLHSDKENAAAAANNDLIKDQEGVQISTNVKTSIEPAITGLTNDLIVHAHSECLDDKVNECNEDSNLVNEEKNSNKTATDGNTGMDDHDHVIKQTLEEADTKKGTDVVSNILMATGEANDVKQICEETDENVETTINSYEDKEHGLVPGAVVPILSNEDAGSNFVGVDKSDIDDKADVNNCQGSHECDDNGVQGSHHANVDYDHDSNDREQNGLKDSPESDGISDLNLSSPESDDYTVQVSHHAPVDNNIKWFQNGLYQIVAHECDQNDFKGQQHADGNDVEAHTVDTVDDSQNTGYINEEGPMVPKVLFNDVDGNQDAVKEAAEIASKEAVREDKLIEAKKVRNRKSLQTEMLKTEKVPTRRTASARKPPIPTRTSERKRSVNGTTINSIPERIKEDQHKDSNEIKSSKGTAIVDARKRSPESQHKVSSEKKPANATVTVNGRKKSPENQLRDSKETKASKVTTPGDERKKSLRPTRSSIVTQTKEPQSKAKDSSDAKTPDSSDKKRVRRV